MDPAEPEDPGARWMAHMRRGTWEEAWRLSDAAIAARGGLRDWTLPRHLQAVWDGAPLDGKRVLVRCYHGLGDTIQFIRLVPRLQAIAAEVTVWAQPALIPLLSTMQPAPRLIPLHDGTPDGAYDADIELMELPHALRLTPATVPADVPYLHPPPLRRQAPQDVLAVGLVWRAGGWGSPRSIPAASLRRLGAIPGVRLHLLQRGPGRDDWTCDDAEDIGSDDALLAASRMQTLDLVISTDTMPAHLAGALGLPVWLLLEHVADWRWMEGRADSPWYPTLRIFRQATPGDWSRPVEDMARRLAQMAALAR